MPPPKLLFGEPPPLGYLVGPYKMVVGNETKLFQYRIGFSSNCPYSILF